MSGHAWGVCQLMHGWLRDSLNSWYSQGDGSHSSFLLLGSRAAFPIPLWCALLCFWSMMYEPCDIKETEMRSLPTCHALFPDTARHRGRGWIRAWLPLSPQNTVPYQPVLEHRDWAREYLDPGTVCTSVFLTGYEAGRTRVRGKYQLNSKSGSTWTT